MRAAAPPVPPDQVAGTRESAESTREEPGLNTRFLRIAAALLIALVIASRSVVAALVFVVLQLVVILRWPRLPWSAFFGLFAASALALWLVSPTPEPVRPVATPVTARARWLRGDYETALTELGRETAQTPRPADSLNLRALVLIAAGDPARALIDADEVVAAQPTSLSYRDTRAYASLKLGRYAEALADYEWILARSGGQQPAGDARGAHTPPGLAARRGGSCPARYVRA